MATQTTANKLVQNFLQNGLTRKYPSFFGQVLSGQALFGQSRGVTPQAAMLRAFDAAGLTVAEATFFGLSRGGDVNQSVISPQPNAMRAQASWTFHMPKRTPQAA